ncbi:MAG TPA: site-specific integrase, partial [Smithellaceae bacterium]|nr:site-specific integrase [Smithellaceae bacterium]
MKELLAAFRTFLDVRRNVSEHTRKAYLTDIEEYEEFLKNASAQTTLTDAGTDAVRSYMAYLHGRKLKKSSINRKISSLRAFYRFLVREGTLRTDPAQGVQTPKTEKYMPTFLSVDEAFDLLESSGSDPSPS